MSETNPAPSKAQQEFNAAMDAVSFSTADASKAATLAASGRAPAYELITPGIASAIFKAHNKAGNRTLSIGRVSAYSDAMKRGEWKRNHMAIAFYPDGHLADGQHRTAAIALSGCAQTLLVTGDCDRAAIDTIDRATRRTAGEALEMRGIQDGRMKATIAKVAVEYAAEVDTKSRPAALTDPQVEAFVHANDTALSTAIAIGRASVENIAEPCIGIRAASQCAFLAMYGGATEGQVRAFLACVQQGIANYSESPTLELSRRLQKARLSERRKDRLSTKETLAMMLYAMALWSVEARVSRLTVNPKALPDYRINQQAPAPEAK